MLDTIGVVERLRPFLRWFPDDALEFDPRVLADAKIFVSSAANPYAPVNRHVEVMRSVEQFRCLLPAVGLQPMTVVRDCVVERSQEQAVVFGANVAPTLRRESAYAAVLEELGDSDRCDMYVADEEIRYYLGLCEDCVQIGVEDGDGMPRALVETDADEVREWAERTFESYLEAAESFTP